MNIVHLSTRRGLELVRMARERGQAAYVETCPQYLLLDDGKYRLPGFESAKFVLSPPLRGAEDQAALWAGLESGEIDTIGTDHCSFHFRGVKELGREDFSQIPNGIPGVEHRPVLLYTAGVEAGDCVVTEMGVLVGVVSKTGLNWSTVSTIINTDTQMGGIVNRTYSAGVLEGDFSLMNQDRLKLNYLPEGAQLVSGDEVLTSGRGEVFPSGLVVGQVEGVFTDPSGQTRYAVVKPAVDLDALIKVFVIKDFEIVE